MALFQYTANMDMCMAVLTGHVPLTSETASGAGKHVRKGVCDEMTHHSYVKGSPPGDGRAACLLQG